MEKSSRLVPLLFAAAAGALVTYFLDPEQGRRRRAILRDRVYGKLADLDDTTALAAADLRNRLQTLLAGARQRLVNEAAPDGAIAGRVRSRIGRAVSQPETIDVVVSEGTVTLTGPALTRDIERLLTAAWSVPGVRQVINRLDPQRGTDRLPGAQA
jgi:hypothetical protein